MADGSIARCRLLRRSFPAFAITSHKQRLELLSGMLDAYMKRYKEIAPTLGSEIAVSNRPLWGES